MMGLSRLPECVSQSHADWNIQSRNTPVSKCRNLTLRPPHQVKLIEHGIHKLTSPRPEGSVRLTGLLPAYPYRFGPPHDPTGSFCTNRLAPGSYARAR